MGNTACSCVGRSTPKGSPSRGPGAPHTLPQSTFYDAYGRGTGERLANGVVAISDSPHQNDSVDSRMQNETPNLPPPPPPPPPPPVDTEYTNHHQEVSQIAAASLAAAAMAAAAHVNNSSVSSDGDSQSPGGGSLKFSWKRRKSQEELLAEGSTTLTRNAVVPSYSLRRATNGSDTVSLRSAGAGSLSRGSGSAARPPTSGTAASPGYSTLPAGATPPRGGIAMMPAGTAAAAAAAAANRRHPAYSSPGSPPPASPSPVPPIPAVRQLADVQPVVSPVYDDVPDDDDDDQFQHQTHSQTRPVAAVLPTQQVISQPDFSAKPLRSALKKPKPAASSAVHGVHMNGPNSGPAVAPKPRAVATRIPATADVGSDSEDEEIRFRDEDEDDDDDDENAEPGNRVSKMAAKLNRKDSLNKFLESRPNKTELQERNIIPSKCREEERRKIGSALERRLSQRPSERDLLEKNILFGQSAESRRKKREETKEILTRKLSYRPTVKELKEKKIIRFQDYVEVTDVAEYDRRADKPWTRLTPKDKASIRKELNDFKSTEMPVHDESRKFTRFHRP